jgi:hypothetical protein
MTDCTHSQFEFRGDAFKALEGWWWATLRVRCVECQQQFAFGGLNSGVENPNEPVVSADGYELRAPIVPRPGGVVGMLKLGGMESVLEEVHSYGRGDQVQPDHILQEDG